MRFCNCGLDKISDEIEDKKIIFFGGGSWLNIVNYSELMRLVDRFAYVIDNNPNKKEVKLGNITLPVYLPSKIQEENKCVIILCSPIYMFDMYQQLKNMNLSDEVLCYALPFMQMVMPNEIDNDLLKRVVSDLAEPQIPKTIHSFWFSGDEKPEEYRKCIDTWKKVLPDYKIIEWNKDNYNWHKHPFVERAIELEAWAFASDYARLDVLNEFGGIYLDADVEVFKKFDNLLGNDAILSFSNHSLIDLAIIGSKRDNVLLKQLLELYDNVTLPLKREEFSKFFQPSFIRDKLAEAGIEMNGSLQQIENATVFPSEFFMPLDYVLFADYERTENTYSVHYDNLGWNCTNGREKKIRDNNLLWKELEMHVEER